MKIDTNLLVMVGIALLAFIAFKSQGQSQSQPSVIVMPQPQPQPQAGDDRYSRAPRPQRFWDNGPEVPLRGGLHSALDPIATRGAPESYQQMGVIDSGDGKILPLYGRRIDPRGDRFNYYTRTDTYNPVALPLSYKRRDCQDNLGCDELMNGEEVRLTPTGTAAKVTLYGFDGPRYNPSAA